MVHKKETHSLRPSPVPRHEILPLSLHRLTIVLAIRFVVHVVFELGVGENFMDHRAGIAVAYLICGVHPRRDIVRRLLAIVPEGKATPWYVSVQSAVDSFVHLLVVLKWWERPRARQGNRP